MQIKKIELSWFRGASQNASLDMDSKSAVVYGANGSGKSSFADAVEYLINKGSVAHLAHEYSGVHQERGIRNVKAPDDEISKCAIIFGDDSLVSASIQLNGSATFSSTPANLKETIQTWDVKKYILRQDEVAAFIQCSKGEKYSTLLPLLGLSDLEYAADNLRQVRTRVVSASSLEINRGRIQQLLLWGTGKFTPLTTEKVQEKLLELAHKYDVENPSLDVTTLSNQVKQKIDSSLVSLEPLQRRHVITLQIQSENIAKKIEEMVDADKQVQTQTDAAIDKRISVLDATEKYLLAVTDRCSITECPSCGQKISGDQLS